MGYAWIDEAQQEIDEVGVQTFLGNLDVYCWTSYESCLCQVNLEGVGEGYVDVQADIAAQGMLANIGYQAFLLCNYDDNLTVLEIDYMLVSFGDGAFSIYINYDPYIRNLLYAECAFLLTSDSPSEITSLQVVRIEPAGAVLTFDLVPPSIKLATPTGLYADNITSDSARTNWQAVENASNYKVQYKAAGDTVWTETYTD